MFTIVCDDPSSNSAEVNLYQFILMTYCNTYVIELYPPCFHEHIPTSIFSVDSQLTSIHQAPLSLLTRTSIATSFSDNSQQKETELDPFQVRIVYTRHTHQLAVNFTMDYCVNHELNKPPIFYTLNCPKANFGDPKSGRLPKVSIKRLP